MFNSVSIYFQKIDTGFGFEKDFLFQIDDSYFSISNCHHLSDPDLSRWNFLFSTSSLDELEIFILKLYRLKDRTFSEDELLHYLITFFSAYCNKLVNEIDNVIGYSHKVDIQL